MRIPMGGWRESRGVSRVRVEELREALRAIEKRMRALRDNQFRDKALYSAYEEALAACTEAYREYLAARERYQETRIIEELYCQAGKIEYRILQLREYVQEELESEEECRSIISRGYYECLQPILAGTEEMERRLERQRAEVPQEDAADRQTLLTRYFRGKRIYQLVEIQNAVRECQNALEAKGLSKETLRDLEKRVETLQVRSVQMCGLCHNDRSREIVEEIRAVTAELEANSAGMDAESRHYERLRECLLRCVASVEQEKLLSPADPSDLKQFKQTYRDAAKALEEVLNIGRFGSAR